MLFGFRFDASHEAALQAGIGRALELQQIPHKREVVLGPGDRIDFLVDCVGLEVKVDGGTHDVLRQLARYAQHVEIGALILFTTRSRHLRMPKTLCGKPLQVLFQGGL